MSITLHPDEGSDPGRGLLWKAGQSSEQDAGAAGCRLPGRENLHRFVVTPTAYIYICTRLTVRKARLIRPEQYMRLLNMNLSQITRFIGETEYQSEVNELAGSRSGIELIEAALTTNLARTYRGIIAIAPGSLHELTSRYLARWDIWNVMLVLRSREFGIPDEQVRGVIIPAGGLSPERIEALLSLRTTCEVVESLQGWEFHPVLAGFCSGGYHRGVFARVENALYTSYYTELYRDARSGIRGGDALLPYIRVEIDILNIRNLFRLRAGSRESDIREFMVPGGTLDPGFFQRVYRIEEREEFIEAMEEAGIMPVLLAAVRDLRCDESICESDAAALIWDRWADRQTPLATMVMAVTRMRLHRLEQISRRHPFSVLVILTYLEHKRYEVMNLRAIARGKEFGLDAAEIRKYLVI